MKDKDNAVCDFYEMVKMSWTFDRMTEDEKQNLRLVFYDAHEFVSGTYNKRWEQLHGMYNAFLHALGYHGGNWRETDADAPLF